MLLRELIDLGKTCKVCGSTDLKNISVRTIWDKQSKNVEVKDNSLIFTVGGITDNCYELFKFHLDAHRADRKIHNPNNFSQMFCNNFMFKVSCSKCAYSFESSAVIYHPMGGLISDVYIDSEEILLEDDGECFKLKNMVHTDKLILTYDSQNRNRTIELPFMTLKDFPIRNRSKMIKKIRTLLLLS